MYYKKFYDFSHVSTCQVLLYYDADTKLEASLKACTIRVGDLIKGDKSIPTEK